MAISTRAGKGAALTHAELDANFTELGLSHGDTDINLSVDQVTVTGNAATKTTVIGDETISTYAIHGFTVNAGDQAWAGIQLKENSGGSKPVTGLANPSVTGVVSGGTVASPTALESGKRMLSVIGSGTLNADGDAPTHEQEGITFENKEEQSSSACGAKMKLETSPDGRTSTTQRTTTLELQDNVVTVNPSGSIGKIKSGGTLVLDDDVEVNNTFRVLSTSDFDGNVNMDGNLQVDGTLDVDGDATFDSAVTLGNASSDSITVNGVMSISDSTGGLKIANITKATADYLDSNSLVTKGGIAFITDGSRANVPIFYDGSDWRYFSDSTVIAS